MNNNIKIIFIILLIYFIYKNYCYSRENYTNTGTRNKIPIDSSVRKLSDNEKKIILRLIIYVSRLTINIFIIV